MLSQADAKLHLMQCRGRAMVQDDGRYGLQHLGVSEGGAADRVAFYWANHLLGNTADAAALELAFGHFSLRLSHTTRLSISGAERRITLNGKTLSGASSFDANAGDVLELTNPTRGVYSYLAIAGGFCAAEVFGSRSMNARAGFGTHGGQPLTSGCALPYRVSAHSPPRGLKQIPPRYRLPQGSPLVLNVIPGAQFNALSKEGLKRLFSSVYEIKTDSNAMGMRLEGPEVNINAEELLSAGTPVGSVQIPGDGKPIVLMTEHQSIGGYPRVGTVYKRDVARLSQLRPGEKVRFAMGSLTLAQREWTGIRRFFDLVD